MSEELEKTKEEQVVEEPVVQLTPEQYEALLLKIEELENRAAAATTSSHVSTVPVQPQPLPTQRQITPQELDDMTNSQLVQYIVQELNDELLKHAYPLARDVEEVKLRLDIMRAESKYPDFWDYKDQILELGQKNPQLGIEEAYLIAKGKSGPKPQPSGEDKKAPVVITGLPPRPSYGEKPNESVTRRVSEKPIETLRDAAARAWDEVVGKDKSRI